MLWQTAKQPRILPSCCIIYWLKRISPYRQSFISVALGKVFPYISSCTSNFLQRHVEYMKPCLCLPAFMKHVYVFLFKTYYWVFLNIYWSVFVFPRGKWLIGLAGRRHWSIKHFCFWFKFIATTSTKVSYNNICKNHLLLISKNSWLWFIACNS